MVINDISHVCKHRFRVYLEDTDKFGLVYHANYVKFFERGRIEWLRSRNNSLNKINKDGYSLVVAQLNLDYLKPLYLDDEFFVETQMIKHRMSVALFSQEICSLNGNTIARAKLKLVALDKRHNPCNIADIL